jgi:hypothetical protein
MSTQEFTSSKTFKRIIWGIGVLLVALVIFQAGVFVGFDKASFSFKGGDNYYRTFGSGPGPGGGFPGAYGVSGKIIKVSLPTVLVAGDDGVEKSILVSTSTLIRQLRQMLAPADLKVDDTVVIIGSPNNQSQIEAKFIRIIPSASAPTQ